MINFVGAGTPLSQAGFQHATGIIAAADEALWAVLSVETSGCGYLPDRRPKILFERHIFSRLTNQRYDASNPDISQPTAGGYGPGGANQYLRLQAALQLDSEATLQSASWGLGQIMGENFKSAGYASADAMVTAMVASEDAQLAGMASFIKANGMNSALAGHDWAGFARHYNGPDYASNNYDGLLAQFFQRFQSQGCPDLQLRAVQVWLTFKGFSPGAIDGLKGNATVAAVKAFQASINAPATGVIDAGLIAQLQK